MIIEEENKLEKFLSFLKENKVYYRFLKIINFDTKYIIKALNEFPFSIISNAFTWSNTEEGHDFWHDLDNKWIILYKINIRNINQKQNK